VKHVWREQFNEQFNEKAIQRAKCLLLDEPLKQRSNVDILSMVTLDWRWVAEGVAPSMNERLSSWKRIHGPTMSSGTKLELDLRLVRNLRRVEKDFAVEFFLWNGLQLVVCAEKAAEFESWFDQIQESGHFRPRSPTDITDSQKCEVDGKDVWVRIVRL